MWYLARLILLEQIIWNEEIANVFSMIQTSYFSYFSPTTISQIFPDLECETAVIALFFPIFLILFTPSPMGFKSISIYVFRENQLPQTLTAIRLFICFFIIFNKLSFQVHTK